VAAPAADRPAPLRIALADDHAIFRQGLKSLLKLRTDVTVVAEAERVDDLGPMLASHPCDILVLDLRMDRSSLVALEQLAQRVTVVVLTMSERAEDALEALRAGARAVVFKRFAIETLLEAIRAAASGHVWLPPELQLPVLTALRGGERPLLSRRERQIVRLVALGLRNAEVAHELGISEETVKKHLNTVFHKLGIRDRVELALSAIKLGIISDHEAAARPKRKL
jgi:DNA-binding NarL/FixJ family response regulator